MSLLKKQNRLECANNGYMAVNDFKEVNVNKKIRKTLSPKAART